MAVKIYNVTIFILKHTKGHYSAKKVGKIMVFILSTALFTFTFEGSTDIERT